MRLLTRKIYRAFPELDSYDDEQCRRFIRSARGGLWRQGIVGIGLLVVGAVLVVASLAAALWVGDWLEKHTSVRRGAVGDFYLLALTIPVAGLGPLAVIVLRDLTLRLRVRNVLRTRGFCPQCRYSLIGLSVSANATVSCPECGTVTPVDPSLAELARTSSGPVLASEAMLAAPLPPSRVAKWGKRVVLAFAAILVVLGLTAGYWEWSIRRQAARATTMTAAMVTAISTSQAAAENHPATSQAWANAINASNAMIGYGQRLTNPPPRSPWLLAQPDRAVSSFGSVSAEEVASARASAKANAESMWASGVADELRALIAASEQASVPGWVLKTRPMMLGSGEWSPGGICLGLAADAMDRGDHERALLAVDAAYAITSLAALDTSAYASWIMEACSADHAAMVVLSRNPPPEVVDKLVEIVNRRRAEPDLAGIERDMTINQRLRIATMFSNVKDVREGTLESIRRYFLDRQQYMPVPSLDKLVANSDLAFKGFAAKALQDSPQRGPIAKLAGQSFRWGLDAPWLLEARDRRETSKRTLALMLAAERFKRETGSYPKAAAELVPKWLPAIPVDASTGRPIVYLPKPDGVWPYTLYIPAANGDRGGNGTRSSEVQRASADEDLLLLPAYPAR